MEPQYHTWRENQKLVLGLTGTWLGLQKKFKRSGNLKLVIFSNEICCFFNPKKKGGNFYFPRVNFPLFPFGEGVGTDTQKKKKKNHKNEKLKF